MCQIIVLRVCVKKTPFELGNDQYVLSRRTSRVSRHTILEYSMVYFNILTELETESQMDRNLLYMILAVRVGQFAQLNPPTHPFEFPLVTPG